MVYLVFFRVQQEEPWSLLHWYLRLLELRNLAEILRDGKNRVLNIGRKIGSYRND